MTGWTFDSRIPTDLDFRVLSDEELASPCGFVSIYTAVYPEPPGAYCSHKTDMRTSTSVIVVDSLGAGRGFQTGK